MPIAMYRGHLTIDFTGGNSNAQNRLNVAMEQAGWTCVETSAFEIEVDPAQLSDIWHGIYLAAKQAANIGTLSNLTFTIQGHDPTHGPSAAVQANHANAMTTIDGLAFP